MCISLDIGEKCKFKVIHQELISKSSEQLDSLVMMISVFAQKVLQACYNAWNCAEFFLYT